MSNLAPASAPNAGGLRFSVWGSGIARYPAGARYGPWTTPTFELVWILEGNVVWRADGMRQAVPEGSVVCSVPGSRELFVWDRTRPTRHGWMLFTFDDPHGELPPHDEWPRIRSGADAAILAPLLNHAIWLLETGGGAEYDLAQSALRHALTVFLAGAGGVADTSAFEHPVIKRALEPVLADWASGRLTRVTLDQMAEAANVSPGYLSRVFRRELGVSPVHAVRLWRVHHASTLLARTNMQVQQIADLCGFEDAFHFSKTFKQMTGLAPRAYRAAPPELRTFSSALPARTLRLASQPS
jgi:AraC-like DNA-binding protein